MLIQQFFRFWLSSIPAVLGLMGSLCLAAQSDTRLPDAARDQDRQTLQALLATGDIDPDSLGQFETPALHWTVRVDDLDTTRLLLESGADPDITGPYGVSALGLAIANGSVDMVSLLLAAGADANRAEFSGESMLMSAAAIGVQEIVLELVAFGAVVDAKDPNYNQTALMFAARAGHTNIVDFFLQQGANPNASTSIGETPRWVGANSVPGFGFGVGIIRGGVPADRGRREPVPGGMSPLLYAAPA